MNRISTICRIVIVHSRIYFQIEQFPALGSIQNRRASIPLLLRDELCSINRLIGRSAALE
jgi:hypothetical protein